MNVRRDRPTRLSEFSSAILGEAQDLLNDNFQTAEAEGYIRDGDVLRVVDMLVWQAMCVMEQASDLLALH